MQAELKQKWIDNLLSGKFKQGQGKLRSKDNEFCCLGVLAHIVDNKKWRKNKRNAPEDWRYSWRNDTAVLNDSLDTIGLTMKQQDMLMILNDNKRYTFKQIASYIKRYVKVAK